MSTRRKVEWDKEGYIYILHFNDSYFHAKHYLGFSFDPEKRFEEHKNNSDVKLLQFVRELGIEFELATFFKGTLAQEYYMKKHLKRTPRYCPICREKKGLKKLVPKFPDNETLKEIMKGKKE